MHPGRQLDCRFTPQHWNESPHGSQVSTQVIGSHFNVIVVFFTRFFSLFFTHHQTITVVKRFLKVKDLIMNINVRLNFSIKERWETNVCRLSVIVRKKENRNWTKSDSAGRASYFERNPESDAVICGCLGNVLRCGERMLHKKHISNLFGFVLFCLGVAEQASGGLDQHVPGGYALPC